MKGVLTAAVIALLAASSARAEVPPPSDTQPAAAAARLNAAQATLDAYYAAYESAISVTYDAQKRGVDVMQRPAAETTLEWLPGLKADIARVQTQVSALQPIDPLQIRADAAVLGLQDGRIEVLASAPAAIKTSIDEALSAATVVADKAPSFPNRDRTGSQIMVRARNGIPGVIMRGMNRVFTAQLAGIDPDTARAKVTQARIARRTALAMGTDYSLEFDAVTRQASVQGIRDQVAEARRLAAEAAALPDSQSVTDLLAAEAKLLDLLEKLSTAVETQSNYFETLSEIWPAQDQSDRLAAALDIR